MATLNEQIEKLRLQIANNLSLINGTREPGFLYSFYGDKTRYGCYVSKHDANTLHFDDSDPLTVNPNKIVPPLRPEEYANISIVYGEVFSNANDSTDPYVIDLTDPDYPGYPSAGFTRNDIIYVFVGDSGSEIGIAFGNPSSGTPVDPTIPAGTMPVAQTVVGENGLVGDPVDLRQFATEGGGGTNDHSLLINRNLANQHSIASITNLQTELNAKALAQDLVDHENDATAHNQNHNNFTNRDDPDQHAIAAITNLQTELDNRATDAELAALQAQVDTNTGNITAHTTNVSNPHSVTAKQSGAVEAYETPTEPVAAVIGDLWIDTSTL